jgi:glycosyltransferase involved in cell wall biosynthesis
MSLVAALPDVKPPRVSVVITNHNYSAFVGAAVRSVLTQTYPWFRCVVVDDCSSDNSPDVLKSLIAELNDARFELCLRSENGGQAAAMADGLKRTVDPFVAFLDADDVWRPDFLAAHMRAHLNTAWPAAFTCSDMALIDAEGSILAGTMPFFDKPRFARRSRRLPAEHLPANDGDAQVEFLRRDEISYRHSSEEVRHWSAMSAMVFRRGILELIWPESHPALRICSDHYVRVLAHKVSGCLMLTDVLAFYRVHGQNNYANNPVVGGGAFFTGRDWNAVVAAQNSLMIVQVQRRRADFERMLGAARTMTLLAELCGVDEYVAGKPLLRARRLAARLLRHAQREFHKGTRALRRVVVPSRSARKKASEAGGRPSGSSGRLLRHDHRRE